MENPSSGDPDTTAAAAIRSLNDFPEHLLLHILSFLPTIDAVKTSSISLRWRNLWSSVSSLYFSYDLFPPSDSPVETRRRYADSVNKTLILRNPHSPLLTFGLEFDFKEYEYSSLIDSWIRYAVIHHQVQNLEIDFYIDRRFHSRPPLEEDEEEEEPYFNFEFPFYVLRNSRVRVLKLTRCELLLPAFNSSLEFASLQTVVLDQISLTDRMVSDLLIGCPNIESFSLEFCDGMENVKIRGLKIKKLLLKCFHCAEDSATSVEIACPNLQTLSIVGYEVGRYSLRDSSALDEVDIYFLHKLQFYGYWSKVIRLFGHVRKLRVQNWWYKLLDSKDVLPKSFKFLNLRWLELQTGYTKPELLGIAELLELSPNLDTLILDYLFKIDEDEESISSISSISEELLNKPINLSLPKLRQAKMKVFTGTENEVLFLSLLKQQAVVCQKIVVVPSDVSYPPIVLRRGPKPQSSSQNSEGVASG